jgi:hypothetical protein
VYKNELELANFNISWGEEPESLELTVKLFFQPNQSTPLLPTEIGVKQLIVVARTVNKLTRF